MLSVAALAAAVLVAGCKSSPTEPQGTRTHSVVATASVPATPTAPVTVATNDPQSRVSLTFDVAALQAIVAEVGGAATIKLTDVAPVDYGTILQGGERTFVQQNPDIFATLLLELSHSSAVALRALRAPENLVALTASYSVPIRFYYMPPTRAQAIPAGTVDVYLSSNGATATNIGTLTITADMPQLISGTLQIPFSLGRTTIYFVSHGIRITGAIG